MVRCASYQCCGMAVDLAHDFRHANFVRHASGLPGGRSLPEVHTGALSHRVDDPDISLLSHSEQRAVGPVAVSDVMLDIGAAIRLGQDP